MIPVYCTDDVCAAVQAIIDESGLPKTAYLPDAGLYLQADADGIALRKAGEKSAVRADFTGGAAHYRRTKGGGELIAKAVNHTTKPKIWDATGGLGRDAFVLAAAGLQVEVFEQHPAVACLLADGLRRAREDAETAEIAARIRLHKTDAVNGMVALVETETAPEVVYLDPMYPERQKSAAVKKEMAYFHELVGGAQDEAALLNAARNVARKRVVVKRPRLGLFLNGEKPAYQYEGKSTRFDVYLPFAGVQE